MLLNLFKKKTPTQTNTQELIDNAKAQLDMFDAASDDYLKVLTNIERLQKLQSLERTTGFHVSADTIAAGAFSLAGILIIVSYEHLHPMLSKAVGFVPKNRI